MTSINAMRFNFHTGAMLSDESRSWNTEKLSMYTPEKVRPLTSREITRSTGVIACMGKTGTSTLGNEFLDDTRRRLSREYAQETRKRGKPPGKFVTVDRIARMAFEEICRIKHKQIDGSLKGKYGFTTDDYIRGAYKKNKKVYEINDEKTIDEVQRWLTWENRYEPASAVFLNAQVIAGYDPEQGFRIYHLSLINPICEPVGEIFLAEGSGVDMCDNIYSAFANSRTIPERRGDIDPITGLATMIDGLNMASNLSVGVGGYYKLSYIDGLKPPDERLLEIADHRMKLASEIVWAGRHGLISSTSVYDLLDSMLFSRTSYEKVNRAFYNAASDERELSMFLRGYPNAFSEAKKKEE